MVPPKNLSERVKEDSTAKGIDDMTDSIITGADGTNEQQLDAMTAGNAFLELLPEGAAGGNASTSANNTDPIIELRVQRPNTSRDELDDEALELMQILRDCVFKTSELTGFLAGCPEVFAPYQYDVSMLDATAAFLTTLLSHCTYGDVRPTADQARRRTEIRNRHYRVINQFRRIPGEQEEVAGADVGGPAPVQEEPAAPVAVSSGTGNRGVDPFVRGLSRVLTFQLDGTDQEGSGSTQEEQDQMDVGGSGEGGSGSTQSK